MPRLRKCSNSKHVYVPMRDTRYEKCTVCKDIFPCKKTCEHLDCCYVKGVDPPPYWASLFAAMGIAMDTAGVVPWSERHKSSLARDLADTADVTFSKGPEE